MHWKKNLIRCVLLTCLLVVLSPLSTSVAQSYSFSLDRESVDVWINSDGSVRLEYQLTFTCDPGAHTIDVVDLGLPNGDYRISDISGDVDGRPIDRVDSDYQGEGSYGVAVWLGGGSIAPGQSGTVRIVVERVGRMIYEDDDDPGYASTQFGPTYFGSEFVHGTTDMTIRFHLPPGVRAEEPRWHGSPSGWPEQPDTGLDSAERVLYIWRNTAAAPDRQYIFGASYPVQYVDEGAIQRGPSALEQLFAAIAAIVSTIAAIICNPFTGFIGIMIFFTLIGNWSQRRRKMQYLPPSLKIEGVGIKRGLTAVEAAILLETPLNKILTMILFGLLKKEAVTVLDDDPLKIELNEPLPEKLRSYEQAFLDARKADGTISEKELQSSITQLIKEVNNKMKGFSRRETTAYYKDIVRRAWAQVERGETPEVRSDRFNEALEWTMMDGDFDGRVERTFQRGPVIVPVWWGYHRPLARRFSSAGSSGSASPGRSSGGRVSIPALPGSAFAAGIVRQIGSTASGIVHNVTDFTGKVTKVTNPPPKTSYSGRSFGGGGSSCACACACAGCACACAGGGR